MDEMCYAGYNYLVIEFKESINNFVIFGSWNNKPSSNYKELTIGYFTPIIVHKKLQITI